MTVSEHGRTTWTNWAGNQQFVPREIVQPTSEQELIATVQQAVKDGQPIGCAGSAHSFSPVVETSGVLIEMRGVSGVLANDSATQRATVLAGTTLKEFGSALWGAGLSMRNQGDVDAQTIVGATSTGTHGSGIEFGSLSSTIVGVRLVTGTGEVRDIDESEPELLRAAQVSLGLLGVITRATIQAMPAYRLKESNRIDSLETVLASWDESIQRYRHFSLFWAPSEESGALYDLPYIPSDHCYVKMLEQLPAASNELRNGPVSGPVGGRTGPAYLIYPDTTDEFATWIELEYMVDAEDGKDAFLAMRKLMLDQFPEAISPIQIRWTKGEDAFLSPHFGADTCSLSVSGLKKHDWNRFLRAIDETLKPWRPRPHWGKMNYLDHQQFIAAYRARHQFLAVREELDPNGLFLSDYWRGVLGL
jgi:FAD/FMN-containing dehydrogenase